MHVRSVDRAVLTRRPTAGRMAAFKPSTARPVTRSGSRCLAGARERSETAVMTSAGPSSSARVRLAELLAVLSLGADLGMGQPMEHAMRQCRIALRLRGRAGPGPQPPGKRSY